MLNTRQAKSVLNVALQDMCRDFNAGEFTPILEADVAAYLYHQLLVNGCPLTLAWDDAAWTLHLSISAWLIIALIVALVLLIVWQWQAGGFSFRKFELDQAEIGVGKNKFSFRPNLTDRQVAYEIWVELSTRKIGLEIDLKDDVVAEIYDSWYSFFDVTRELIKGVPVSKIRRDGTQAIIKLSIAVLNEGLRPHLTKWQARYRQWYNRQLKHYESLTDDKIIDPQEIQKNFPQYDELSADLLRVNKALMLYREKMRELALKD